MNMIEQIKADRETGTPGPWSAFTDDSAPHTNIVSPTPRTTCVFSLAGRYKGHPDIQRACRVPDMEAALIAADELAEQANNWITCGRTWDFSLQDALKKYRAATGAS